MSYATTPPTDVPARVETSWDALHAAIAGLTPEQLEAIRDTGGWSIKDHLAHVAAWEASLLALLTGGSRLAALDLREDEFDLDDFETINAALQQRSAQVPAAQVLAHAHASHEQLVAALAALGEQGLSRPYADFQPEATENRDRPVRDWVGGNTYEHYDEHRATIAALLEAAAR
ncbi:MAG TPA: DinB family protein [Thermomicrobiaceae bacterium]|nr:DinB family protein [Thermomicrobiaceae bacterium]